TTGTLIFAKRYKGEANQYDVNSMYIFEIIKKNALWPIASATIEGNSPKKSLQLILMNISPNALIYERNVYITGKDMFGEWGNILYKIKKESVIEGKLYYSWKVELKTEIEIGELKFEKNGVCVVKNCISIIWKLSYSEIPNLIIFKENELHSTNSLPDFEKIQQDKKQNTILNTEYSALQTAKRKLLKKSNINLLNKIIIEIFQHLRTQNKRLCGNNELLFLVLYVNK
ncbi:22437_t:CDS:2, partial [Cetraspora pellucida]